MKLQITNSRFVQLSDTDVEISSIPISSCGITYNDDLELIRFVADGYTSKMLYSELTELLDDSGSVIVQSSYLEVKTSVSTAALSAGGGGGGGGDASAANQATIIAKLSHTISADETGNSTKITLGAAEEFEGAWENVLDYTTVSVAVLGTNITDGTLYIEASQDGGTVVNSVPFPISNTTFQLPKVWNVVESHIRIRYVNGAIPMTGNFQLQTKYSNGQDLGLAQAAGDTINANTAVQIVKAILTGTDPNNSYNNGVVSGISNANSSIVNLGISESFTGVWKPLSGFHGITVLVDGTSAGTSDGTLYMEFSHDGITTHRSISVPVGDVTSASPRTLGTVGGCFRVRYVNGTTAMTSFDLQTMFHTVQPTLISRLSSQLNGDEDVTNVRAVITSQQPNGDFRYEPHNGVALSTTANLAGDASYQSAWIDTDGYNSIELFIASDQISSDRGIQVEFTDNLSGTPTIRENIHYTFTDKDVIRGFLDIFLPPRMVGFRIEYENGSTPQTSFLLQCDLKINGNPERFNTGGALIISDFSTEVALGNVPNHIGDTKYGVVRNLDAADTDSTIWSMADDDGVSQLARKTFPSVSSTLYMASSSGSDTAKEITIIYNDANNVLREVSVDLNGQTSVDTGVTALDVNVAYISEPDGSLSGDVFFTLTDNFSAGGIPNTLSDTIAHISASNGRTQQATIRVPANSQLVIENIYIALTRASGSASSATVNLNYKPAGKAWFVLRPFICTTNNIIDKKESLVFGAGDFIEFSTDVVSDTDTSLSAIFKYEIVKL